MPLRYYRFALILTVIFLCISEVGAAIPSGYYYFAQNKKKAELKTALHKICAPVKLLEYGSGAGYTWEGFYYTDKNDDNSVIDMYSDNVRSFNGFSSVRGMNIEHSFPKSWWGSYEVGAYKDLFHLYPADSTANIIKNNLPLGEITGVPTFDNGQSKVGINGFPSDYSGKCFEPADEFKGDFARSYFYISTVYEDLAPLMQSPMLIGNNTYPFWKLWSVDLLLKWHRQDPVSEKEQKRLEAIYGIQGNRNPFIDYPDLAEYIWGADSTKIFPFPAETQPFLIAPRRGETMDLGVILKNDVRSGILHLQGINISSDIQLSLKKHSSSLSLSVSSVTVQQALNGVDVTISFSPVTTGFVRDTILIEGGGLATSVSIPVKALASSDFITLEPKEVTPVGGTLQWISQPNATDYHLKLYQNEDRAGDLIISAYVEGNSWNKALEIFNETGHDVDLSKYSIQKQSNGAGDFGNNIPLSGILPNFSSYILVNSRCSTAGLVALANKLDSLINFNGNDAVVLTRGGVVIDQVGIADAGAAVYWGEDISLSRNTDVTHPLSKYDEGEWTKLPFDTYSILRNHQMGFVLGELVVLKDVMTGLKTEYEVPDLMPQAKYTYSVEAITPNGNMPAVNTMQLHTSALEAPEISEASNISEQGFTANWGASAFASGYLLNVFELTGKADTTETEGFDNVGSKGKPLPDGWSGTASGNYESTASSGVAIPSVQLKADAEWLQTKTYSLPVKKFSFMYRFASTATGSSFGIYGLSNGVWTKIDSVNYVNTSKTSPVYTFEVSQNMKTFRIIYHKAAGNLAIDDVSATYGNQERVYVIKDYEVSDNFLELSGLLPAKDYFYNVRSTLNESVSSFSETMNVTTLLGNKLDAKNIQTIKIISQKGSIIVGALCGDETLRIFSLDGSCIYQGKAQGSELNIPFDRRGCYLLQIQSSKFAWTYKILK